MAQEKKYDVFISYSRKDFDEVNTFVEMLKRRIPTLDIWFDLTGIESGDEFRDKIISAIKRSQYVLFALSINSDQSKWTRKELQFASGKGKKIVPILLKGSKLEDMDWFLFEFGGVSYVDITDSKQIEQLIKNLASWTGKAIHSNQLKVETDEPVSLGSVQELQEQIAQAEAAKKELEKKMRLAEEKAIKKNHQLGTIVESIQSIKGNDNSKTFDIILKSAGKCKLQVVKIIKEQTGLGLKESKDIVDAAPSYIKRNVNKEIAVAIKKELDEVGAFVELYENSKTFDVILKSAGACKLQVVKIIKEQTGLGLKESKDIVDAAPSYITRNIDRVMAETIKKELEKVGAYVEIR